MKPFFVHESCCPLIKKVASIIKEQDLSVPDITEMAGVNNSTIHSWFKRHSPSVNNLNSVLNVMGYELVIQKKNDDVP